MSPTRICPNCQADIPSDSPPGVCPFCALRAGFYSAGQTLSPSDARSRVMPAEQVASHLPELDDFELIGPGGMGTVYKARQRELGRPVAVKILHPHLATEPSFADRFTREARTLARLDHPNIVRVYDCGHRDGLYYLVMELVEGVTLRQGIEAGGFEPKEALAMVPLICGALQYAHDNGVVHRDIKPENILIAGDGSLKVADFGLAKLAGATEPRLTATEQVMGTPHYMAPEQIEKPEQVDHRADIFALGVVFYEMLTGELPVGLFPPPSDRVEVDVRLDRVVLRTLEKEPNRRYQHASDLQAEVESLSGLGVAAAGRVGDEGRRRGGSRGRDDRARGDYEYRSRRTLWGWPLVHIASGRDADGRGVRMARGIVAIGDVAVGVVALGGVSLGLVAAGGLGVGVVSLGGLAVGLLVALGGLAVGAVAAGGASMGAVAATGPLSESLLTLPEGATERLLVFAWVAATLAIGAAAVLVALAFIDGEDERAGEARVEAP
jgi:hypothetical protein